jgi:pyruvate dehydrogenase E2 component (dihydrolipoamide acetyltransferase)
MAVEVKLPRLGQGMESGTIVRWLKAEGEPVSRGEPLYELDTDKVTQEVEAEADGVLLKVVVVDGEVPVGTTIAVIGAEGEDVSELLATAADGGPPAPPAEEASPPVPEPTAAAPAAEAPPRAPGERVKASPLARRIARERGVDLATVAGTGPDGRIVAEDVEQAAAAPAPPAVPAAPAPAPGEVEVVELTSVRRTIARRLTEAWEAPVFQLTVGADATQLVATRERMVERLHEGETKPTVSDVLTRLVAAALMRHRAVNAHFVDGRIHRYPAAHVGIAVATPNGLVVPVVRDADRRSVLEIAAARADLVARARGGKLQLADLEGGTFTISNLGMYGIDQFVAVLNPPQVAILAVGSIEDRPAALDGELVVLPLLTMTLTCDHRALDGSEGAEFLQTVKALVEEPALAL